MSGNRAAATVAEPALAKVLLLGSKPAMPTDLRSVSEPARRALAVARAEIAESECRLSPKRTARERAEFAFRTVENIQHQVEARGGDEAALLHAVLGHLVAIRRQVDEQT